MRLPLQIVILLAAMTAAGATYYVDPSGGSDAAAGTSTGAAWAHLPGDDRATGSATTTLASGDTVVIKGGTTYAMDATSIWSANSHGITILGGHLHSPQWGTSIPVVDCSASDPSVDFVDGAWNLGSYSNIVVRGLRFTGGAYIDSYNAHLVWRGTGGTLGNLLVRDCEFADQTESAIIVWGSWDAGTYSSTFVVSNCTFSSIGTHGVFFRYGLTNCQVISCAFTNVGYRTNSPAPGGDPVGVFGHDSPSWNSGLIVRGNVSVGVPIKSFVILSDQTSGALIEKNYITGTNGYAGLDINGNATNLVVRNNVFDLGLGNYYGPLAVDTDQGSGTMVDGLDFVNNTVRAAPANIGLVFLGNGNSSSAQTSKRVTIKNNVLISTASSRSMVYVETSGTGVPVTDLATFSCDYNSNATNGYSTAWHLTGTNYSWSGWQGLGFEANGKLGTPTFSSGMILDASDTVAKDSGANLSASFSDDYLGNARTAPWDIGAYEYQTPTAPAGLTASAVLGVAGNIHGP